MLNIQTGHYSLYTHYLFIIIVVAGSQSTDTPAWGPSAVDPSVDTGGMCAGGVTPGMDANISVLKLETSIRYRHGLPKKL